VSAIDACSACGARTLTPILDLGATPLANSLLSAAEIEAGVAEERFPLALVLCEGCSLFQITERVPPEKMFREYLYFSSFSDTMQRHAAAAARQHIAARGLSGDSFVVEIASNDGYLLRHFRDAGVPVLGIEPARNIAKVARERGIDTIDEFFGADLAARLVSDGKRADLILANNVMAHVPDVNGIVAGVAALLKAGGAFVMETPYVKDLLDHLEFDTVYHEHLFYYSLTALDVLFRRHGLRVVDVEHFAIHGGTLRVTATPEAGATPTAAVASLLQQEEAWGVRRPALYRERADRFRELQASLRELLVGLRREGKRVAAYGAAAKGATLLNATGIGRDTIEFVVDRSTYKQGRFMPGVRLPILPPERLLEARPDYVLLLTWNFADEILAQQAPFRAQGGKFIVPVPTPKVV
jgi:SAM-dependent methyltransferase